jgi:hypothetical protein
MEREPLRPTGHFERRPLPYPLFGQQFVQVINASYRPPGKPDDQIPFRQAGTKRNAKSALARPPRPSSPCSGSFRDRRWRSPTDPLDLLRLAQRRRRQVRRSGSDGYVTDTACPGRILLVEQQVSLSFDQRPKQTHKRLSRRAVLAHRRDTRNSGKNPSPHFQFFYRVKRAVGFEN